MNISFTKTETRPQELISDLMERQSVCSLRKSEFIDVGLLIIIFLIRHTQQWKQQKTTNLTVIISKLENFTNYEF